MKIDRELRLTILHLRRDARDAGHKAYKDGESSEVNPYQPGNPLRFYWLEGYFRGLEEAECSSSDAPSSTEP